MVFPRVVLSLLVLASACASSTDVLVDNPTPGVTSLSPATATQGDTVRTLVVVGSDFVPRSVVRWNGADRPTVYVSRTELRADLRADDVATVGDAQVTVYNPPPGGGVSNGARLSISARTNPVPVLEGTTPASLWVGDSAVTLTLSGSGFAPGAYVIAAGGVLPTTYVSATQITAVVPAEALRTAGTMSVVAANPPPGGGRSAAVPVAVVNPVPAITALGSDSALAGEIGLALTVDGAGFTRDSKVNVDGVARPTTYVSTTRITAALSDSNLRAAGTISITVTNRAPGGGTSNARTITLVNAAPRLTRLPSRGGAAGRPGFALAVDGTGFVASSVVTWNGVDRPTTYLGPTRLTALISAADVASSSTVQIAVRNPPPGGGTTGTLPFTVRAVAPATLTSVRRLDLPAGDLVYDPRTARLYATVPDSAGAPLASTVAAIDPTTGTVTANVFVGAGPKRIAISEDGQYLYVALEGARSVRRVALPAFTAGLQFSVAAPYVEDLVVLPRRPQSVAVIGATWVSGGSLGLTIYDEGTPRPRRFTDWVNSLAVTDDAGALLGYQNETSGFSLFRFALDAAGVTATASRGGVVAGYYDRITWAEGRVYSNYGTIVDPETFTRTGTLSIEFETGPPAVLADPALGRLYHIQSGTLRVFDLNNLQELGRVKVAPTVNEEHPAGAVMRLVRWGTDGLAFRDGRGVYVFRTPLVAP